MISNRFQLAADPGYKSSKNSTGDGFANGALQCEPRASGSARMPARACSCCCRGWAERTARLRSAVPSTVAPIADPSRSPAIALHYRQCWVFGKPASMRLNHGSTGLSQLRATGRARNLPLQFRRNAGLGLFPDQYGTFDADLIESARFIGLPDQHRFCVPTLPGARFPAVEHVQQRRLSRVSAESVMPLVCWRAAELTPREVCG